MATVAVDGVILVGSVNNSVTGDEVDGFIARFDADGVKLWEIALTGPNQQLCRKIIPLADGNFIVAGYDLFYSSHFFLKLNASGVVLWRKNVLGVSPAQNPGIMHLREGPDGSLYFGSFYSDLTGHGLQLYKTDAAGNFIYSRFYRIANPINPIQINDILVKDGYVYVAGAHMNETGPLMVHNGFLCKINGSSGALQWTKLYNYNGADHIFQYIFEYSNNRLCILGQNTINSSNLNTVLLCDTSGAVTALRNFQFGLDRQFGAATLDSSGNLLYVNYNTNAGPTDLAVLKFNPVAGLVWARHYPSITSLPRANAIRVNNAGDFFITGMIYPSRRFVYLAKSNDQGDFGCNALPLSVTSPPGTSVPLNIQWSEIVQTYAMSNGVIPPAGSFIPPGEPVCVNTVNCNSITVSGKDTICSLTETFRLAVVRNPGCNTIPNFLYDPAVLNFISFQNDTANFAILQAGNINVVAEIRMNCDTLRDTLQLVIRPTPQPPELGSDFSLCQNNTITLHAGPGFLRYRWQDGSADSVFQVTVPGTYYVETSDYCGNVFSDTIHITPAPPVAIDIGPDRTICPGDTIQINAPTGFISYLWGPDFNISNLSGASVAVHPSVDTVYFIRVEERPGCYGYDSVRVGLFNVTSIQLGNDTSFCASDSLSVNAGPGFSNYNWNTGHVQPQIILTQQGTYWVTGTTTDQCSVSDTIRVVNVWPPPMINLGNDGVLCEGTNRLLQPGVFNQYLWQDGSNGPVFQASGTGLYYVTVTDAHQCSATDSVRITTMVVPPVNFLGPDTSICNYGNLQLNANGSFTNYSWNTGSAANTLTVTAPGWYWLRVTDFNGCTGTDSVLVKEKECIKGFYIPVAFTPNNDGLNDFYYPIIGGRINRYHFTIYNRWGEIVFDSKVPGKGWDGKLNGISQNGDVFVWRCVYELEGAALKQEKGTMLLIR